MKYSLNYSDKVDLDINNGYTVSFEAEAEYVYVPGKMYMNNGDPGYPPDEELDIKHINIKEIIVYDDNGDAIFVYDGIETLPDTEKEQIVDELYNMLYELDLSEWNGYDDLYDDED